MIFVTRDLLLKNFYSQLKLFSPVVSRLAKIVISDRIKRNNNREILVILSDGLVGLMISGELIRELWTPALGRTNLSRLWEEETIWSNKRIQRIIKSF